MVRKKFRLEDYVETYTNDLEFFGGKNTISDKDGLVTEYCFTVGSLKLDKRFVIVERKSLEYLIKKAIKEGEK